jgi:hypothetical protein
MSKFFIIVRTGRKVGNKVGKILLLKLKPRYKKLEPRSYGISLFDVQHSKTSFFINVPKTGVKLPILMKISTRFF